MARSTSRPMFFVINAPGPFRLMKGLMAMFDEHKKLVIKLTVVAIREEGPWSNHAQEFKVNFEVALMGSTSKGGHSWEDPSNVRLLGKFMPIDQSSSLVFSTDEWQELSRWQWEVTFNPQSRGGFICKLDTPLPDDMTI